MNHRISCEIIQDLMPMYADGLTSETTNREIQVHLEECDTCREMFERMKADMVGASQTAGKPSEIDYLKKVRRRNVRNVVLGASGVFLVMAAVLFMKLFVIGYPTESYMVTYTDVNGEQVNVGGIMIDSAAVYRGYKLVQEDGAEKLVIYSCLPSFWNRSGTFNLELGLPGGGKDLDIQGITIKSSGIVVSSLANELYRARNPYIGDASADGRLSGTLGISRELGVLRMSCRPP